MSNREPHRRDTTPVPAELRRRLIAVRTKEGSLSRAASALHMRPDLLTDLTSPGFVVQPRTMANVLERLATYEALA